MEAQELEILIEGKVVKSNLDEFCSQLKNVVKSLNRELETDADFEAAGEHTKFLKSAEKSLQDAKQSALEQALEVNKLFAAIDDVSEETRQARLGLERQIKQRKAERKLEIIHEVAGGIKYGFERVYSPKIEAATSGKKTFASIESAAVAERDRINDMLELNRKNLDRFIANHGQLLVPDQWDLIQKDPELLQVELERRVERAEAEAQRKKLEQEKREAEERAKVEIEKAQTAVEATKASEPPKPEPAPIKPPESVSASDEILFYCGKVKLAFSGLKDIKASLRNERSKRVIEEFSMAVNAAFLRLKQEAEI